MNPHRRKLNQSSNSLPCSSFSFSSSSSSTTSSWTDIRSVQFVTSSSLASSSSSSLRSASHRWVLLSLSLYNLISFSYNSKRCVSTPFFDFCAFVISCQISLSPSLNSKICFLFLLFSTFWSVSNQSMRSLVMVAFLDSYCDQITFTFCSSLCLIFLCNFTSR